MQRNRAISAIKAEARWRMVTDAALSGHIRRSTDVETAQPLLQESAAVHHAPSPGVPGTARSIDPLEGKTGITRDIAALTGIIGGSWINILLVAIPFGFASEFMGWGAVWTFFLNFLALIPLALILGDITEDLALRFGPIIGGLINATFGNVVEIILSVAALMNGLFDVVAYSLLGSILSNLLLVLGCCMLFGGVYFKTQQFNELGNRACSSLLFLSVIGIILPTAAKALITDMDPVAKTNMILTVSRVSAVALLLIYVCYLFFQLKTHKDLFEGGEDVDEEEPRLSVTAAMLTLTGITVIVSAASEFLTGSIEEVSHSTPLSKAFLGMIVLPIAGNACEHITAVIVAMKNKMDLALGVAVGSSLQIALLALPLCVIVGWITNKPFGLDLDAFSALALTASVIHANFITSDATSHWLMGAQLLVVYIILAITYFYR